MAERQGSRAKGALIAFLLFALCVAGAYGFGRWQGAQLARGVEERAAANREGATARGARARGELAELRGQVQVLQARRHLHLAQLALDDRNFGMARDHLVAAGDELAGVVSPPPGADTGRLSQLSQELRTANVIASENFADQRNRITAWMRELDAQFPESPAPPAPSGPAAATDRAGAAGADGAVPGAPSVPPSPGSAAPGTGPR